MIYVYQLYDADPQAYGPSLTGEAVEITASDEKEAMRKVWAVMIEGLDRKQSPAIWANLWGQAGAFTGSLHADIDEGDKS